LLPTIASFVVSAQQWKYFSLVRNVEAAGLAPERQLGAVMRRIFLIALILTLAGGLPFAGTRIVEEIKTSEACAQDADTICADVLPGDERVRACLKANVAKLSRTCAEVM
jgi:hypothetical protein